GDPCILQPSPTRRSSDLSLMPPQMPNFSPLARAYSRHSRRTTQPRHTSLASLVDAPRSGKKRSGSTPRQLAWSCHVRSNTSILTSEEHTSELQSLAYLVC